MEEIMRPILIGAALAFVGVGVASADMSGLVGNTVVGVTPDKLERRIQLHADGSYRITVSDGSGSTGTWSAQGSKLCYTRINPPPQPGGVNPFCVDGFDGHKVGDTWTTPGRGGAAMSLTVVAGQ
jgi:hypothetical protein